MKHFLLKYLQKKQIIIITLSRFPHCSMGKRISDVRGRVKIVLETLILAIREMPSLPGHNVMIRPIGQFKGDDVIPLRRTVSPTLIMGAGLVHLFRCIKDCKYDELHCFQKL
uniref:Uncharacterized protein n=1 Tax=Photinus pyralis TaxID=7054 RepID=A0A1Y1LI84_PHOPY